MAVNEQIFSFRSLGTLTASNRSVILSSHKGGQRDVDDQGRRRLMVLNQLGSGLLSSRRRVLALESDVVDKRHPRSDQRRELAGRQIHGIDR